MTYEEREQLKSEGWQRAHSSASVQDRASGLLVVIQTHFLRSAEAHKARHGNLRRHGGWDAYAASWLAANGDRADGPFAGLGPVIELLRDLYPAPRRPRIPPGGSYWET